MTKKPDYGARVTVEKVTVSCGEHRTLLENKVQAVKELEAILGRTISASEIKLESYRVYVQGRL